MLCLVHFWNSLCIAICHQFLPELILKPIKYYSDISLLIIFRCESFLLSYLKQCHIQNVVFLVSHFLRLPLIFLCLDSSDTDLVYRNFVLLLFENLADVVPEIHLLETVVILSYIFDVFLLFQFVCADSLFCII